MLNWVKFLESHIDTENQHRDFGDFKDLLKSLIESSDYGLPKQFYRSYSYTAQSNKGDLDPEKDFQIVNNWMTENGWSLERAKLFAKNWKSSETFADYCLRSNISKCAPIDYYLYKITDGEFPLQGYEWTFFGDTDWEKEEFEIRFRYGWHLTRYGRMCIEQNLPIKQFFNKVSNTCGYDELVAGFAGRFIRRPSINDCSQHYFIQDDECYLDLESFLKWIESESSLNVDMKNLTEMLTEYFNQFDMKVRIIGQDAIIKFK
jgi:hypothetical protein